MAEISYIMQNGQQVNLKDAKGRELLAEKQVKLIAGRGISIADDGTISVIGSGSSAAGFFINASGDFDNLTFDKTPVEVNTAIEQGNIVIINVNNAKFLLSDVKDNTYLFSYLVAAGEDCLAQIATIIATAADDAWQTIKTNFVAIKAGLSDTGNKDIYHEDDDLGADFSDWSEYQKQDNLLFVEQSYWGGNRQIAYYVDENGDEVSESLVDQYNNENPEVTSRIQGIAFYESGNNTYINPDFVKDNYGELELDAIRFKDGFNMAIEDDELQSQLSNYQDTLILGEGLEISDDGTISLKEQDTNE